MQLQPPTATHLRIRSIHDAHKLFHAVYMRMLPMVVRRLDAEERKMIKSGDVHVWEERGPGTEATGLGIERWTDGRLWGPSRVRDCFLFYHEKDREPDDFHAGSKWSRMLSGGVVVFRRRSEGPPFDDASAPPSQTHSSPASPPGLSVLDITENPESYVHGGPHQDGYSEPRERLVKQTYSVLVRLPDQTGEEGSTAVRKWHMTAYFSSSPKSQQALRTVDDIPAIATLQVPDNMYEPARAGRGVTGTTGRLRSTSASASTKSVLVPPLPASMVKSYVHYDDSAYPPTGAASSLHHHHRERAPAHASTYPRYTPYQHRSTPASPTVEYDEYPFVVPSQKGHDTSTSAASTTILPPLQYNTSAVGSGVGRLRPLSTISTGSRSRSRSSSTSTTSTSISSTMSPPTPSHFPPLSPSNLTLSPLPLTPKTDSSVDTLSLVPLSFLENVRHNLQQPLAWSSPSARRSVDEEVVRNLEFRP